LAPYLAQVGATDASLRTAAADVNGDVGATTLNLATATRAAIEAAAPTTAGNAIPAGLPGALLQRVMLVQSDLVSRWAALVGYSRIEGTTPLIRTDPSAQRALECLANGAAAAAATHADTGALEAAAAGIPPIAVAAPDTEAAADIQILLQDLELRNLGCAGCGGARDTALPPVEWYPSPKPSPISGLPAADGTVGSVEFTATYAPAAGWQITIHAC